MAKTLDTLVTETLGAQLRMILELQAQVEALRDELAKLKPTTPVLVDAAEKGQLMPIQTMLPPPPSLSQVKQKARPLDPQYGAFTNTVPQPISPTPLQAPNLPGSPAPPNFNYNAPTVGAAPTPTAFGSFTAPTLPGGMDPYQFRVDQANKGAQRSAAAHGSLLSGGFQAALAKLNQGLASEEEQNIYGRARDTYALNRDTNAQNFNQQLGSYQAGTGATLDAGRLGLGAETARYDRAYGAGRDAYGDARDAATTQTGVINANQQAQDAFRQQMEQYRAAVEAARMQQQPAAPPLGFAPRAQLPGQPGVFGRMR